MGQISRSENYTNWFVKHADIKSFTSPYPYTISNNFWGLTITKSSTNSLVILKVCDKPKNVSLILHICYYKTAVGKIVPYILVLGKYPQWSIFREIRHNRIWVWKCLTNVSRLGRAGKNTSQVLFLFGWGALCISVTIWITEFRWSNYLAL